MLAKVFTSALNGVEAALVEVEVQARHHGKPRFIIIGLADGAVRESRDRVLNAINLSGFHYPDQILVNLAPAELRKEGSGFDLAIAVAVLAASGQIRAAKLKGCTIHGELSLEGRIKPVRSMVAAALGALQHGIREVIVPKENASEAALVDGIRVTPVASLAEIVAYLQGLPCPDIEAYKQSQTSRPPGKTRRGGTLSEVWGQESAKRAMLIAAAGGHNLLMIGPPGCGKTMLAERFASLLPDASAQEKMEAVRVHSAAGMQITELLGGSRPFRSPHHVISDVGLIGGGSQPRPGEISLAHTGVLFLDEFPEFRRSAIEALRAPLESGRVTVTRAKGSVTFPARFQLLAAMNPCPCGRLGVNGNSCSCSPMAIQGYLKKLSQPILDRIDLHCELQSVPLGKITAVGAVSDAGDKQLQEAVRLAQERQYNRVGKLNAGVAPSDISRHFKIISGALGLLERSAAKLGLSARAYTRILRVAATICDLAGADIIDESSVAEALSYRGLERFCCRP